MSSAGFDAIDASDWLVCDTLPIADEVSLFTLEVEQPLKPTVMSTDTLISCFLRSSNFISEPLRLLNLIFYLAQQWQQLK